jgi:hypothetical protein
MEIVNIFNFIDGPVPVPVNDASWVDVLHAAYNLIDEELHMVVRQLLRLDDIVQVGAHQVGYQVPLYKKK